MCVFFFLVSAWSDVYFGWFRLRLEMTSDESSPHWLKCARGSVFFFGNLYTMNYARFSVVSQLAEEHLPWLGRREEGLFRWWVELLLVKLYPSNVRLLLTTQDFVRGRTIKQLNNISCLLVLASCNVLCKRFLNITIRVPWMLSMIRWSSFRSKFSWVIIV